MHKRNKGGEMTVSEIVQLLLATAGIVIVILLFYQLMSPSFNKTKKTSEAYFDIVLEKLEAAKVNQGESQKIITLSSNNVVAYYLVYFGEGNYFELTPQEIFIVSKNIPNQLCVCSIDGEKIKCDYCEGLEKPITINGNQEPEFSIPLNEEIEISFEDGHYKFKTSGETNG
jgi:hypothetical protein